MAETVGEAAAGLKGLLERAAALDPRLAAEWKAKEARDRALCDLVRIQGARAIESIADAIQQPIIARRRLEEARGHLERALSAAAALDPE